MTALSQIIVEPQVPARFTIAEFEQLCATNIFEASKVELVDGVIVRMNLPLPVHTLLQRQIFNKLNLIFGEGLDGRIAMFELGTQIGEATLRGIDVAVINGLPARNRYFQPRDVFLAIEVAHTTLKYDLGEKRLNYAGAGIPFYWVVDPEERVVHVRMSPTDGDYATEDRVAFGNPLAVPGTDQHLVVNHPFEN